MAALHKLQISQLGLVIPLLFFAVSSSASEEEKSSPPTVVQIPVRQYANFPVSPFELGPVGCRKDLSITACRPDGLPSARFEIIERSKSGSQSRYSATIKDGCVVLELHLTVDHRGSEGRICMEPVAGLDLVVALYPP